MHSFSFPDSCTSQKYYKLRKDAVGLYNGTSYLTPPTTPAKRKASTDGDEEVKHQTPTKRAKKTVKRGDSPEIESSSNYSAFSDYSMYQNHYAQNPFSSYMMRQMHTKAEENDGFLVRNENNQV